MAACIASACLGGRAGEPYSKDNTMNLSLSIGPIVSLIAGILILLIPRLLNYIVAIYLIVIGLIGLFGSGSFKL
jgi:hypothetical protein